MPSNRLSEYLLLIPTDKERDGLLAAACLDSMTNRLGLDIKLCGFGPIAAAAATARFLSRGKYRQVFLAGIAGSYCASLPVGTACLFEHVGCWGVGAGSGKDFKPAPEIGFSQLTSQTPNRSDRDLLRLSTPEPKMARRLLLTCCGAAQTEDDCLQRLGHFPEAVAEDMEGFGVALACREAEIPLTIVRGISNRAGDRGVSSWSIAPALAAAAELLTDVFSLLLKTEREA